MTTLAAIETVIGLEIHVQIETCTKLFCGDPTEYGLPPNSAVCPVCLGLPGALPRTNREAVKRAVRAAYGLRCTVHDRSVFERKSYFYPDTPKGYQITQHEHPIATGGHLATTGVDGPSRRIGIRRLHLEEDSGKSMHDAVEGMTAVDFNRAGIPLLEIVTEPDIRSPEEARTFLERLKRTLRYLRVSACRMEEGGLRVDANISVRPVGASRAGVRTEVKNLNSFRAVERALVYERERQASRLRGGDRIPPETLAWDERACRTRPIRSKEEAPDYRYLPDPDLPPLGLPRRWLDRIRADLPELPGQRRARYASRFGLPEAHVEVLIAEPATGDYFEEVVRHGIDPRRAASWMMGEVFSELNARGLTADRFPVRPADLAGLVEMAADGVLSRAAARDILGRMVATGRAAADLAAEAGSLRVRDRAVLARWVDETLAEHPEEARRLRSGERRLLDFFIGRVMERAAGRVDPVAVRDLLEERL